MALMFKPHTWAVYAPQVAIEAGIALSPTYPGGVVVRGQISGVSSSTAYEQYGVEVTRGYELLMDPADEANHPVGAKVFYGSLVLKVRAAGRVLNHGLAADNAAVLAEEER